MKIIKKIVIGFISLLVAIFVLRYIYLEETGNFHAVTKGVVYRSAQLDADELEEYIAKYNIRSILNLRGKKEDKSWYQEEERIAKQKGVVLISFRMSPRDVIPAKRINQIIDLMQNAPKPMLIHCKAGADRSGLVAAIWKLVVDKAPPKKAHKQLSLFYGHVPYLWSKTKAMDESFWNYVKYLRSRKQNQSADRAASKQDYWWQPKAKSVHLAFSR